MPEKVSKGVFDGDAEVPSWSEFCELKQRLDESEDNKQALWFAVNQFKRDQGADIYSEFRALRDAAFTAYRQLNGPLPDGEWTAWKCIEIAGKRLDALDQRLNALPDAMRETVREVVRAELKPLLESAMANIDCLLKGNGELASKSSSLSNDVERCRARVENAEKQFQGVPDAIAELQKLIDDAKTNLNCAEAENNHLREEVVVLRESLANCRKDIDALVNSRKGSCFSRMFSRGIDFFRKPFFRVR